MPLIVPRFLRKSSLDNLEIVPQMRPRFGSGTGRLSERHATLAQSMCLIYFNHFFINTDSSE